MAENEQKGWFGSYSSAGRNSAEKYHLIVHKEEILANLNKKLKLKGVFSPNEKKQDDSIEDIDIFRFMPHNSTQGHPNKRSSNKTNSTSRDKFHYHNKHKKEAKNRPKQPEGPLTKYNPKMDYVWKNTVSGPPWKTIPGRKKSQSIDCKDFYIKPNFSNTKPKGFVELNKQTMRLEFPPPKDIRIKNETKYNPNCHTASPEQINQESTYSNDISIQVSSSNRKSTLHKNNSVKLLDSKSLYSKDKALANRTRCFVPDFKRSLSRDQLDKRFNIKKTESPFIDPNYNSVLQRPIMMVTYHKSCSNVKNKEITRISSSQGFDLDKKYIQKPVNVPNFDLMVPRPPGNNDPLPSYMKQIYTRASVYNTTEKTLEKNNYANAGYLPGYTSFYPKKSFNSIINLNLLHSENLASHLFNKKGEFSKLGNYLSKAMKFYKKNYDEELYDSHYPKFDAVTYKAYKKTNNFSCYQLENYLANIDDDDNNNNNNG